MSKHCWGLEDSSEINGNLIFSPPLGLFLGFGETVVLALSGEIHGSEACFQFPISTVLVSETSA